MTDEVHLVIVGSVGSAWDEATIPLVQQTIRDVISRYQNLVSQPPACCPHPDVRHVAGMCKDCPPETMSHQVLTTRLPFKVGSGESPEGGVDIWAHEVADAMGVAFVPFAPAHASWPFYKKRNQAMADWCTHLVRVTSKKSLMYGSGWTRDRAKEQGKFVEEFSL